MSGVGLVFLSCVILSAVIVVAVMACKGYLPGFNELEDLKFDLHEARVNQDHELEKEFLTRIKEIESKKG